MSRLSVTVPSRLPIRVFVGSSSEQRGIAAKLCEILAPEVIPVPWWNAFPPGETTIGSLVRMSQHLDLGVFVISPDDLRWKNRRRNRQSHVVRDNVLFELGLFAGALGSDRSLMLLNEADVPEIPSDLAGVTQVRWNQDDDSSFDRAAYEIAQHAENLHERLGLGWWAVRFDNDVVDSRSMYGVFEICTAGRELRVRYGNTHYAESFGERLQHRLRSTWESLQVSLVRSGPGQARLLILADVTSHAPNGDIEGGAYHLKSLIEVSQTDHGNLYRGRYFDIEGLSYYGRVTCRRLGHCDKAEAEQRARAEFAGTV
jgi:hypothetical protein